MIRSDVELANTSNRTVLFDMFRSRFFLAVEDHAERLDLDDASATELRQCYTTYFEDISANNYDPKNLVKSIKAMELALNRLNENGTIWDATSFLTYPIKLMYDAEAEIDRIRRTARAEGLLQPSIEGDFTVHQNPAAVVTAGYALHTRGTFGDRHDQNGYNEPDKRDYHSYFETMVDTVLESRTLLRADMVYVNPFLVELETHAGDLERVASIIGNALDSPTVEDPFAKFVDPFYVVGDGVHFPSAQTDIVAAYFLLQCDMVADETTR